MDPQEENQYQQYVQNTPGIDFRTTQIMLIDELLDILYSQDEILIPENKVTQLDLSDLAAIVEANRLPETPQDQVNDSPAQLKELFILMKSGTFFQLLNEQLEHILPDNIDISGKIASSPL